MNFLICKCTYGVELRKLLEDVIDENEGISKAKKVAEKITKEDATVALFTEEGHLICGWLVKDGNLKAINNTHLEGIKLKCGITDTTFSEMRKEEENEKKRIKRKNDRSEKLRVDSVVK